MNKIAFDRELRMCKLSQSEAAAFYEMHQGKEFFARLLDFMTSGRVVAMELLAAGLSLSFNSNYWGKLSSHSSIGILHDFFRDLPHVQQGSMHARYDLWWIQSETHLIIVVRIKFILRVLTVVHMPCAGLYELSESNTGHDLMSQRILANLLAIFLIISQIVSYGLRISRDCSTHAFFIHMVEQNSWPCCQLATMLVESLVCLHR